MGRRLNSTASRHRKPLFPIRLRGIIDETVPVDGRKSIVLQVLVGLGKVLAIKESAVGREGRRVDAHQDQMFLLVDQVRLVLGVLTPKQEDYVLALVTDGLDSGIQ